MASPQPIIHPGLHRAALDGDDEAVRQALARGADINVLDDEGRTPIMCAVAGEHWQDIDASDASFMTPQRLNAIRHMLHHPQISLHCLNAPHAAANGVIPLSMAAWLNFPELVKLLLEESTDTVAVDGLDAHGATALMYASRDNSLQVVQLLLSHGARPDLRDCNFRSSIQYALPHPQILWLCENVLRRHRWRESQSADTLKLSVNAYTETNFNELLSIAHCSLPLLSSNHSNTLIEPPPQSIFTPQSLLRSNRTILSTLSTTPDIPFLRSILFSPALPSNSPAPLYPLSVPILVNRSDERGWSAIHHACSFIVLGTPSKSSGKIPEIEILDMLYLAGADVSLFTTGEHYTPLHILTKTSTSVPSSISPVVKEQIRDFVTHLVRDLGAPLGARDKNDETCLHLAAEYGASNDVLGILLDLDRVFNEGRVSKMKNSRGLVASELAIRQDLKDSFAAAKEKLDMATVRRGSVSSALSDCTVRGSDKHNSLASVVADEFGVTGDVGQVLQSQGRAPLDVDPVETTHALLAHMRNLTPTQYTLDQMNATTTVLINYFQARIQEAKDEVEMMKKRQQEAKSAVRDLGDTLCSRARIQSSPRLGTGVSKGKGIEMMKRGSEDSQLTRVSSCAGGMSARNVARYIDVATQASGGCDVGDGRMDVGTMRGPGWAEWLGLVSEEGTVRRKKDKKVKDVIGEFGFVEEKGRKEKDKGTISGAHRLKSWWKKMMVAHDQGHAKSPKSKSSEKLVPAKLELAYDIQDPVSCPVGHERRNKSVALRAVASMGSLGCLAVMDGAEARDAQKLAAGALAELAKEEGDWAIARALRKAPSVLSTASKDLGRIEACLRNAEEYLKSADKNVERIARVLKRALKKRRAIMEDLSRSRTSTPTPSNPGPRITVFSSERSYSQDEEGSPSHLGYTLSLSLRPSIASIASVSSKCSVLTTATATAAGPIAQEIQDDDDTKTMRRLLLRRVEAQLTAMYDEVDRVVNWIAIVQDVVGGVKRRAYL